MELRELGDLGGGRVLAHGRVVARGAHNGESIELSFASVWTLRGERVARLESYRDRAEAITALGGWP